MLRTGACTGACTVVLLLSACGGGGGAPAASELPQPVLQATEPLLVEQQVKTFSFRWNEVAAASHYRLLENPDGVSGYSQVGVDIPAGTGRLDIEVPLCHRLAASYILQSCDASTCLDADQVQVSAALVDSVGYFKASNSGAGDQFGFAVAISDDGNTLAVGAPSEDSAASGIDGDQSDNSLASSGAVYIFSRQSGSWQQQAYIKAHNPDSGDQFGYAVSLSADGSTLAVAAHYESSNANTIDGDAANNLASESGAVYVFVNSAGSWAQQAYIKAPNSEAGDRFGWSLGLDNSGDRLVVAAPGEDSTSPGVNGNLANNAAPESGAAYLFQRSGGAWAFSDYFKASNPDADDSAGFSVSISGNGTTVALGAHGEASASSATPSDNSAAFAGAVYLFRELAGNWSQQAYLKSGNIDAGDNFGWSVSLDDSGTLLAVGAYGESSAAQGIDGDALDNSAADSGAAYLYSENTGSWVQQHYIKSPNSEAVDLFAFTVRLSGDGNALAVGAYGEGGNGGGVFATTDSVLQDNSLAFAGAAYLYMNDAGSWQPLRYLKPGNAASSDLFAWALDLSADGNSVAVGAQREQSAAQGIAGDAADDSANDAGALYLY